MTVKGKAPADQFYFDDWYRDSALAACSPSTRGIWFDLLCMMWDSHPRGLLSGTAEAFERWGRCSAEEWTRFIAEAEQYGFCDIIKNGDNAAPCHGDVTLRHGVVTVKNRRMFRKYHERDLARLRQKRHRSRLSHGSNGASCNDDVTPLSPSPSPTPNKYTEDFETFWTAYPRKVGKQAAFRCWKARLREGYTAEALINAAENYSNEVSGRDIQKVKYPSTFLGPDHWIEDYLEGTPGDSRRICGTCKHGPMDVEADYCIHVMETVEASRDRICGQYQKRGQPDGQLLEANPDD